MEQPRVADKTWDPEKLLPELLLEAQYDDYDCTSTASRILRENAITAAHSIAHLSAHAGSERIRLQASQYIVERTLEGKFDHDIKLHGEQIQILGSALAAVVRSLGLKYGFDPDDPEVKRVAHDTLLTLEAGSADAA